MDKLRKNFPKYVSDVFKERFKELGLSQYRFIKDNEGIVSRQTLTRIMRGNNGISATTLALYADLLGLDIIFEPQTKQNDEDIN